MRFLIAAALRWLLRVALAIAPTAAAASALDGHWTGISASTNIVTLTATTASSPDIIIVGVAGETLVLGGAPVTYTVSGCSLAWTLRPGSRQSSTSPGGRPFFMEQWWAPAPTTLAACTITATGSGPADSQAIIGFGVSGAASAIAPFDPAIGLPSAAINNSGISQAVTGTVTTAKPDDFIYSISMTTNGCGVFQSAPGAQSQTGIDGACNTGGLGAFFTGVRAVYLIVNATQSAAAFGLADSRTFWIHEIDAITADSAGRARVLILQ